MSEEYLGMDAEEFERAKEWVKEARDCGRFQVADINVKLLQLEMLERIGMQITRIANTLERLERN